MEATALPTKPQPLPKRTKMYLCYKYAKATSWDGKVTHFFLLIISRVLAENVLIHTPLISTLPWTSKFESVPTYNPPLRVRQAAERASNLHKTCSSPSIFAMAGDSSWKAEDKYDDLDLDLEKRFERNSDIFLTGLDVSYAGNGNDCWRQNGGNHRNSSPTPPATSFNDSKESTPRRDSNRSRESSMSDYREYKFHLLNHSRRSSLETNQLSGTISGEIDKQIKCKINFRHKTR